MDFRYLHRSEFQVKSSYDVGQYVVDHFAICWPFWMTSGKPPSASYLIIYMDHLVELVGLCVVNDYLHRTPCIQRISNSLLMMTTKGVDDWVVFCIFRTPSMGRPENHARATIIIIIIIIIINHNNNKKNNMILIVITHILYICPLIVSHELIAPAVNFCFCLSLLHLYFRADTKTITM